MAIVVIDRLAKMSDQELTDYRVGLVRKGLSDGNQALNATLEMLRRDKAKRLLPARI